MKSTIAFLLILGLAIRLVLLFLTPLIDAPSLIPYYNDESAHLNYVRYLANHHSLPIQTHSIKDSADQADFEYYQPPLYYLLTEPIFQFGRWLTPGWELYWVRLVSIFFTMGGVIILFLTLRRYMDSDSIVILTTLIASCSGVSLRFGSLVTNDSLLFLEACLFFALIMQISRNDADGRVLLAGLAVVSAGLWTKASFIFLIPVLPLALFLFKRKSLGKIAASVLIPPLAILPWYLHNWKDYGKFLPLSVGLGPGDPISSGAAVYRITHTGIYFIRTLLLPFDQLWGGRLDAWIWLIVGVGFIIFVTVGIFHLLQARQDRLIIMAAIGLNLLGFAFFNFKYFQAEARLLFPVFPFLALIIAYGIERCASGKALGAMAMAFMWLLLPWIAAIYK
jgi:4-amino-4-deoxy-L-arabinose transferase-like glycosyltransferase